MFEKYGAEIIGDAPLIDGGLILVSESSTRAISNLERIEYLELNRELEFFYLPQNGEENLVLKQGL